MTKINEMLEKIEYLKSCDLNCNVFSVYDYNGYSLQDLLCQFFEKINNCIQVSNQTINLVEWLVNEGLKEEVARKLEEWFQDGTLASIINETLFKELNKKIDSKVNIVDMPSKCIHDFGAKGDGVSDDTQAFIEGLKNSKSIYLVSDKTYVLNDKIILNPYNIIEGNNATIVFKDKKSNIVLGKGGIVRNLKFIVDTNLELDESVLTVDGNLQYNVGFDDTPVITNITGEQKYNDGQKRNTFIHLKAEQENAFKQCYISGVSISNIRCIRFKFGYKVTCKEIEGTSYKTYVTSTQLNNFHAFNCENFLYEYDAIGKKASIGGNIYVNCHFQPIDNGYHIFLHNTGNGNIIRDCDFWDNSRCVNDEQIIIKSNNNVISGGKIPPFDTKYWKIEGSYNFIEGHTYGTPSSLVPVLVADRNIYRYFNKSKKTVPFIYNVLSSSEKSGSVEKSINKIDLKSSDILEGHNIIKFENFGTGEGSQTNLDFNLKVNGKPLINGHMSDIYSNSFQSSCIIDIRKYSTYNDIKAIMKIVVASGKIFIFSGNININHSETNDLNFNLFFKSDKENYLTNNYSEINMIAQ